MELTILRGAREIGGSCVLLRTAGTRLLIDAGKALREGAVDPELDGLDLDGVLISHPHRDHFGMIEEQLREVPIHLTALTRDLIEVPRIFLGKELISRDFRYFQLGRRFQIGDLTVTPHLVDHSACEAYAFLIECEEGRVLYSGDFRGHGRKSVLYRRFCSQPPADVDVLIMEGTMVGRDNGKHPDERAVEDGILEILRSGRRRAFLVSSSQNVDRLVSAYRACRRCGRELVVDCMTAWVVDRVSRISPGIMKPGRPGYRVYVGSGQAGTIRSHPERFGSFLERLGAARIDRSAMEADPGRYLTVVRLSGAGIVERFAGEGGADVIYSMWDGYLSSSAGDRRAAEAWRRLRQQDGIRWAEVHTSGHATVEELERFVSSVAPRVLIPMHTEHPDRLLDLYPRARCLDDGEPYTVGED